MPAVLVQRLLLCRISPFLERIVGLSWPRWLIKSWDGANEWSPIPVLTGPDVALIEYFMNLWVCYHYAEPWLKYKSYYQLVEPVNGILSAAGSIKWSSLICLASGDTAGLESVRAWQQETGTSWTGSDRAEDTRHFTRGSW